MKFWIGTSGFQYAEWKGNFYPGDLPAAKMLSFYAERLSTTEINYTFHRIPAAKTIDNWKTTDTGAFSLCPQSSAENHALVKAPRLRRHARILLQSRHWSRRKTRTGLISITTNFKKDADVLSSFLREFPDMRAAFEFRHESWFDDEIYELLKSRNIALCIADTDTIAAPKKITAAYGYLRLRREDYQTADVERWGAFVLEQNQLAGRLHLFQARRSGIGRSSRHR